MKLSDFTNYVGDVNLEYGGMFIDFSDYRHGYADCLKVTDLDSGCGFAGAVMVERITVYFDRHIAGKDEIKSALQSSGFESLDGLSIQARRFAVVESMAWYGLYDVVSDMSGDHRWIIQCEPDEETSFDGWIADIILGEDQDLFEYLYTTGYLSNFE
jgi:hypothetical protein